MINNRQAGRRRGRGGNNGGGNGPRPNGQRDTGNRIDSRARGNANQLYEKYKNLAADAQRQGDRVNTEYYLQFADHYFRVLSETRSRFEEQNQQRREAQPFIGSFDTGFDGGDEEYADEGEPIRAGEQAFGDDRGDRDRDGRNGQPRRDDRPRGDQRDDRQRADQREDRPRADQRDDRSRDDRQRGGEQRRDAQPRDNGDRAPREQGAGDQAGRDRAPRDMAPREDGDGFTRRPRRNRDEVAPVNGAATEAPAPAPAETAPVAEAAPQPEVAEAPRRRGRPRRERPADEAPAAFDAALLPPSLGIAPAATAVEAGAAEGEEKPRRRRVRATPAAEVSQAG